MALFCPSKPPINSLFKSGSKYLLVLLLISSQAAGQTTLRKDLKKDFGAVGDGRTNDQPAFQRAAEFFNQRAKTAGGQASSAVLRIPKGTYLVRGKDANDNGVDVLRLVGCHNLTITGADSATTEIRYADGLHYGAYDPTTHQPYEAPKKYFTDWSYANYVGTCIVLEKCDQMTVTNLQLNGNSAHLQLGGHWGDTGIQLACDGIFVSNSRHLTFRRLAVHHFGRDGMQVLNRLATSVNDSTSEGIVIERSTYHYNGRQGLSLTGVNGVRVQDCSFSHTGRVRVQGREQPLFTAPGAGIDLEPEWVVTNVHLENCRFVDNAGQAMVSDRQPGNAPAVRTILVKNCLLWGTTNHAAWITQPGFLFENCRIYGAFMHGCNAANAAEATRFVGCTFEDRPYHGQPAFGRFLLESDTMAQRMHFIDCRFVSSKGTFMRAIPAQPDTVSAFQIRNCTFVVAGTAPTTNGPTNVLGAVFSGSTTIANDLRRTSLLHSHFLLGDSAGRQPATVRGQLRLAANGADYLLPGGLDIRRLSIRSEATAGVVVANGNTLALPTRPGQLTELYIGPYATLTVEKGGALELMPHTKVTVAGQLVVEDGAYFSRDKLSEIQAVGAGELRVSPTAILSKHP